MVIIKVYCLIKLIGLIIMINVVKVDKDLHIHAPNKIKTYLFHCI
jgi:hypothetical protein